jgi:hypothetical protein
MKNIAAMKTLDSYNRTRQMMIIDQVSFCFHKFHGILGGPSNREAFASNGAIHRLRKFMRYYTTAAVASAAR